MDGDEAAVLEEDKPLPEPLSTDQHDTQPEPVPELPEPEVTEHGLPDLIWQTIKEFCDVVWHDPVWHVAMRDGRPVCVVEEIDLNYYRVTNPQEGWVGPLIETAEYVRAQSMVLRGR